MYTFLEFWHHWAMTPLPSGGRQAGDVGVPPRLLGVPGPAQTNFS
jgi:hypothetical protein